MVPYSNDLRKKIIEAYLKGGESQRKIASRFSVSVTFVNKLVSNFRRTGGFAPKPHGGGRRPKLDSTIRAEIADHLKINRSVSLARLREMVMEKFSVEVSNVTIFRAVKEITTATQQTSKSKSNSA
jgi:transposase